MTVLLAIAAYLAIDSADMDPNDPGAADVAFFVSPIIAIGAAIVTGVLLVRVSARGLIGIGLGRARRARRLGPIIAPVAYLAFLIAIASPLDAADSGTAVSIMSFIVPTVMGIGLTLAAAVVGRPSRASGTDR